MDARKLPLSRSSLVATQGDASNGGTPRDGAVIRTPETYEEKGHFLIQSSREPKNWPSTLSGMTRKMTPFGA